MNASREGFAIRRQDTLTVSYAVLPNRGEDSFAVWSDEAGSVLCVADGCGGLGSRRYGALGDRTGAYVASRLAVRVVTQWAREHRALPQSAGEGQKTLRALETELNAFLRAFAEKNKLAAQEDRIVGSMQRVLPTTLCAALTQRRTDGENCCFLWAGDSRGYTLDADGLHQYTRDDVRSPLDSFERLYCDAPLSNCLSADQPARLHMRRTRLPLPGVLICATDGAFSCLPTPMEFEMLLLSTMRAGGDETAWQRKLGAALRRLAGDDATVLCRPCGFDSYAAMKQFFQPRLDQLKATYITPVRRRGREREFARSRWQSYRAAYDRTEGTLDGQDDWLI